MNRFVAVDGEAYTIEDEHRYVLMADSLDRHVYNSRGLSTVECLEFLLELPKGFVPVAYGWNYDTNMIFRDLPLTNLVELWTNHLSRWKNYQVEWIPGKWLAVRAGKRRVKVSDVFGFFQTSFVNALRKWEIEPAAELEEMKLSRSRFDKQIKDRVIAYCKEECKDLVTLMDELEIALESVELRLSSWVGAGAIASSLLRKYGVDKHHSYDQGFPSEVLEPIRCAYFGGRTELFQQGIFPKLYDYDISSAYPSEAISLPSLKGGEWRKVKRYAPAERHAIWECSWSLPSNQIIAPFPYRQKGDIYYPRDGRGWYHACEVAAAKKVAKVTVHSGWIFDAQVTDEPPFDFITDLYRERAQLKRDGHGGEKVLKLGLNAIYGKLAQGYGYAGKPPPFQSYFWAGMITAGTRARVLDLASTCPKSLVMVATDGIFFSKKPPIIEATGLGGIELTEMDDVFIAQPGVYQAKVDGEYYGRSRGFFAREIDFDDLREGYGKDGAYYVGKYDSTRFCGLGYAILTHDTDNWRRWVTAERSLSLYPSRKFALESNGNPIRHTIPTLDSNGHSEPYQPKESNEKSSEEISAMVEYIWGIEQPLRSYD